MAKETFYFSHDYNARNDAKVKRLLTKFGYEGYGLFWAIIEDLYNNANALHLDYDCIAFDLRSDVDTIKSIVNDFGLFIIKDNYFYSSSVETRLTKRNEKSNKARESASYRWDKKKEYANALPTQSDSNAIKESKVKESKELAGPPTNIDKAKVFEYLRSSTNRQFISKEQCEQEADLLVEKFNGNQIVNLKTLCISWAGKMIPWPKPGTKLKSSFT